MGDRYFLRINVAGKETEGEVSLEEYCEAERKAGFHPKLSPDDPMYMLTPATASFGCGIYGGRIEYSGAEE